MLFDTHCHLDAGAFDGDRAAVWARAQHAGVERLVNPAYDLPSCRRAISLAEQHPNIYAAVGIHPNDCATFESDLPALRALIRHPKVVAIGEIGLDYHWQRTTPAQQAAAFAAQIELAREFNLPIIVHCRDAYDDALTLLETHAQGLSVVLHAFAGNLEHAQRALRQGWLIGIGGPLTYRKADSLREIAAAMPLDHVLLETDSPYLPPHPHRGRRNEPAYVALVAERLSQLRSVSLARVADETTSAALRFFKL
ncbi:MAG: TatD family hydrolase [Anaerolineae bacterium]|nr:TatD family hydrolase [Thermoflexales bacterium]MDW8408793.1 TatD family hydrolase [Anaerolineae bacterium]